MCYGNILESSMRHARKAHHCDGCRRLIAPGRAYQRQSQVDGRSFEVFKWCLLCVAKMRVVSDASGDHCVSVDDDTLGEIRGEDTKEWRESLRDAMRSALAKLKPRRRAAGGGA